MARCDEYSLLLLAGGKSLRMGKNKAELSYRGRTFPEHMLEKARHLGLRKFFISGSEATEARTVRDIYTERGPLGGIHACMQVMQTPYCLVLPVDAPLLPEAVLETLLKTHEASPDKQRVLIWEHGDRKEPLIAVYPTAMAGTIEELIREQPAPVFRALERWGYDCCRLELPGELVLNVNTPELYRQLEES